jgi:hypothetical protein
LSQWENIVLEVLSEHVLDDGSETKGFLKVRRRSVRIHEEGD